MNKVHKTTYTSFFYSLNSPLFDYVEMLQVEMFLQEPRLANLKALDAYSFVAT